MIESINPTAGWIIVVCTFWAFMTAALALGFFGGGDGPV